MITYSTPDYIKRSFDKQRSFFLRQVTKSVDGRIAALHRLKQWILAHEEDIAAALYADLHKSKEEAYLTETSIVLQEIALHLKHVRSWSKPKAVATPIQLLPSRSYREAVPLGNVLILAPWNYPFQLTIGPLVGALAAGNTAILKPSPAAKHTALLIEKMVQACFSPELVAVIQGDVAETTALLDLPFDLIFFTGSSRVGKIVMQAASKHLTPVILELGGKSPCVVDRGADLKIAAKRIAWGKTINAGQTCIAPDHVWVHESCKDTLIAEIRQQWEEMFGKNPSESPYFGRIIDQRAFARLEQYLDDGKIYCGGQKDAHSRYIAPTILTDVPMDSTVMKEEIFGPILPILAFQDLESVKDYHLRSEKPLAAYFFGEKERGEDFLGAVTSGGACINDTLLHIANHHLPFGGVGNSGMGRYHGKASFEAFSHQKSVLVSPTWFDIPFKYAPFKNFEWIRRIV